MSVVPHVLVVLDGFGVRQSSDANAIALARTPVWSKLVETCAYTTLEASGLAVGLPVGQMGNSEVGHLNLGAGRVIYQDIVRIDRAIAEGDFFTHAIVQRACALAPGQSLHLIGLVSDGGVHSHLNHLLALIEAAAPIFKQRGLIRSQLCIHVITDGRYTGYRSALAYIETLELACAQHGVGRIVSVVGRYFAMDRDKRHERTEQALRLWLGQEASRRVCSAEQAIVQAYAHDENDEFIVPTWIEDAALHTGVLQPNDHVLLYNFRADRMRQITACLMDTARIQLGYLATMTEYDAKFALPVLFEKTPLLDTFGEIMSQHHLKQVRLAETEKYAHVTYFFNGGVESAWPGEERVLVPSPRDVKTYDLKPAMSAVALCDRAVEAIATQQYAFVLINFANPDMVGHTGNLEAAIQAIEVIDAQLARIVRETLRLGGRVCITADHGNCEMMKDEITGEPHTAHTTLPVPLVLVEPGREKRVLQSGGCLADVAPTLLSLMQLPIPQAMTGRVLTI